MKEIVARTRFGSVYNWRICKSEYLNDKQKQNTINKLNNKCQKYRVFINGTGIVYCRKAKDDWLVFLLDIGGYKWLKSDMNDAGYDPYYFLGVHYFYLADVDGLE